MVPDLRDRQVNRCNHTVKKQAKNVLTRGCELYYSRPSYVAFPPTFWRDEHNNTHTCVHKHTHTQYGRETVRQ